MFNNINNARRQFQQQTIFKRNNLNLKITCAIALIFLLLNKLEKSFTFIVT